MMLQRKYKISKSKLATNSRSSIQNIINWRLWSRKSKLIIQFNNQQPDIDKIYLNAKVPYEVKYQFLIKKRESVGF